MKICKWLCVMLLITTTGMAAAQKNVKAPISDSIDVLNYSIHLDIIHLSNKIISGYADLTITPKVNGLNSFYLWLLSLSADSVFINAAPPAGMSHNDTILRINMASAYNPGDTFTLRVYYHGMPVMDPSGWGGFYFSSDSNFAYNLGVGFESEPHNYGRVWFPCIDDFVDRATYDCYITTKDDKMAVCGGTLMDSVNNGNGSITWYWRLHNSIPSYLASVAVGPYVAVTGTYNGIAGNVPTYLYVRAGDTANAKNAFVHLNDILGIFEQRFGPYRFERVGYAGVPFNSGAMEHATNIAYPLSVLSAGLAYESLYAHELSHMWFGDLVTCATAGDMWINEGWARYCESVYKEILYGADSYKSSIRSLHQGVVQLAHVEDNGYRAVYGIPSEYTYGTTVYDKGADVIHTLRGYLGDSLFFDAARGFLEDYAFNHISTLELRDYMSARTGVDLTGFFDAWLLSPGFPHFSVDSFTVAGSSPAMATVFVRQRLNHAPAYANDNVLEITFMDNSWSRFTDTIKFSGANASKTFEVPFVPTIAFMDLYDKISDAITSFDAVIKSTGNKDFATTYCSLTVNNVSDSAFVRIEHSYVPPDPMKTPDPDIHRLSDYRHWKVDGIFPPGFTATAKFRYNRSTSPSSGYLDNTLMTTGTSKDSLLLLYRRNTADDWHIVPFTLSGTATTGNLIIDTLQPGEYTLAIGMPYVAGTREIKTEQGAGLKVFPNPSNTDFSIEWVAADAAIIRIFNHQGIEVFKYEPAARERRYTWNPGNINSGNYVVKLYNRHNQVMGESKIIYIR